MLVAVLHVASVLSVGCAKATKMDARPNGESPVRQQCETLLWTLNDCGTEGSALEILGKFDLLMQEHGRETLADMLKTIARQNKHLSVSACWVLSRYVSAEQHAQFQLDLKKDGAR